VKQPERGGATAEANPMTTLQHNARKAAHNTGDQDEEIFIVVQLTFVLLLEPLDEAIVTL